MTQTYDFLVIGSGLAGLLFALDVAEHGSVAIITKKTGSEGSTNLAQGGISAVLSSDDNMDLHIADTLLAGDGLCAEDVVKMVVERGPESVAQLVSLGVPFQLTKERQNFDLGREGGHTRNRIAHVLDRTGQAIEKTLLNQISQKKKISFFENHIAIDLITSATHLRRGTVITTAQETCCGAYVLDQNREEIKVFRAKVTALATGGSGKVYLYTSNPDVSTGDGIAMAYRAGATVANLEFVQFHPTCLYHPKAKNFLISEAVRGEGGVLRTRAGEAFMEKYDPVQRDLACRDIVARAIDTELKRSGDDCVYLDITMRPSGFIRERFPTIYEKCLQFGLDMTKEPIPVVPAAHYMCGGVACDMMGRTDIRGLYAIGETACTGFHGANRLASNSLLEAVVFAKNAAKQALIAVQDPELESSPDIPSWDDTGTSVSHELVMITQNWNEIRRIMWGYVGIVRSDRRLTRAERRIEMIQKEIQEYYWNFKVTSDLIELRNLATVAQLIIQSAQYRKESRGLHYNIGYPNRNDAKWRKNTLLRRSMV